MPQRPEDGESDGDGVDGYSGLASPERLLESSPLDARKLGESRVLDGRKEVGENRERELGLRLGRPRDEHAEASLEGLVDERRPDRRLAHPRLAREQQSAGPLGHVGEEAVRLGDLPLAPDHEAARHQRILIDREAKV